MVFANLLLVFALLAMRDLAGAGYAALGSTTAFLAAVVVVLATLFYGLTLALARVLAVRRPEARAGIATVVAHLFILEIVSMDAAKPQISAALRAVRDYTSLPITGVLCLLALGALYLLLRRLPAKTLEKFAAITLGISLVATAGEAVLRRSNQNSLYTPRPAAAEEIAAKDVGAREHRESTLETSSSLGGCRSSPSICGA